MIKKRNAYLAGFFNMFCPGLGYLYLGKLNYAIIYTTSLLISFVIFAWTRLLSNPTVFILLIVLYFSITLLAVISASILAMKQHDVALNKYQNWYVYLAFFLLSLLIRNILSDNRAQLFGYETFHFPSGSMIDTILPGDYIMSDTWKYKSTAPSRGDLIVFIYPPDPSLKYIKRVIGLPGDMVEIFNGKTVVNGKTLVESYIVDAYNQQLSYQKPGEYHVPDNHYFVLGDNRDNSNDSRFWGFVPSENIHASVEYIYFSINSDLEIRTERLAQRVK